jgi:hypothetical protein
MRTVQIQVSAHGKDRCHGVLRQLGNVGDRDGIRWLDLHPSPEHPHDMPNAIRMALKQMLMAFGRSNAEYT